jgi:hypothetical protein
MQYVISDTQTIQQLSDLVDAALGFPIWGTDADTGELILPTPGQDPATVRGVSLHWAQPIPKHDDPTQSAYPYDATSAPFCDAAGLHPVELPTDWFPPFQLP